MTFLGGSGIATLALTPLLAFFQLPLGLIRKKYSCKKDGYLGYLCICTLSVASEAATALISPVAAFAGLVCHVAGSRLSVFGLTGGIACGKSALSDFLNANSFTIIDADDISHRILEPGQPAYMKIVRHFGQGILNDAGHIDRTRLRQVVFMKEENRTRINRITHFYIFREILWRLVVSRLWECRSHVVIVAPLLLESQLLPWLCSPIIAVYVDDATQMKRLIQRDGARVSEDVLRRIVESQMPSEEKRRLADVSFDNSMGLEKLYDQVIRYFEGKYNISLS